MEAGANDMNGNHDKFRQNGMVTRDREFLSIFFTHFSVWPYSDDNDYL